MVTKVIVADDQEVVRKGLASLLAAEGIEIVAEATTGSEAVSRTKKHKPDVLLIDVRMPDMDGAELLAKSNIPQMHVAEEIGKAEALIDFSHVKGHGSCGYGGAMKNLSMGCVDQATRGALHGLEGGLEWDQEKCTLCRTCEENCPNRVISFPGDSFKVFYHNCKLC